MSKRFRLSGTTVLDDGDGLTLMDCTAMLNHYYEENKGLKSSNMEYEDALARLEEKNKELRKQIDELIKGIQDGARESADAICKPLLNNVWGKGE